MNDVDYCLKGSIGQAATDAKSLNLWTTCTMNKTAGWLTGKDQNIDNLLHNFFGDPSHPPTAQQVADMLQKFCPGTPGGPFDINHWSSAQVLQLQMYITQCAGNSKTPSDWNAIIGAIGPFSSMISSSMTQDTTTGDTEGKNMQSQLQTDNSALQPIADFGGTWANALNSLSNLLAQMSVA